MAAGKAALTRAAKAWRLATDGRRRRRHGVPRVCAFTVAVALPLCVAIPPAQAQEVPVTAVRIVETTVMSGEQALAARWTLPTGSTRGLALLQHGFTRRCANLAGTMRHWAEAGLAVLCVDVSGVSGAAWLPDELADTLADDRLGLPGGEPLPRRIVVAGHSAGATFAARVGARLAQRSPARLAGAVLLDPVASPGLAKALAAVSSMGSRPVLAALAQPGPCNADGSAGPVLSALRARLQAGGADGFVGVRFGAGSTHVDAEGEDTGALAVQACGQGEPQAPFVHALRELGVGWAVAMVNDAAVALAPHGIGPGPDAVPLEAIE